MTPTQLRAYAAVVRLGSVNGAASELGVTNAAVSGHVGQLRKELHDQLFHRAGSGLAFTPGGLRLASRANEILGLQDLTVREIGEAGVARRVLRLAVSDTFAEFSAPGLIELFSTRADDLEVELSVQPTAHFAGLLASRQTDVAIGPALKPLVEGISSTAFLKYQIIVVAAPSHPLARGRAKTLELRGTTWSLGPSAAEAGSIVGSKLAALKIPEEQQRIFQSNAAAMAEVRRGEGVSLAVRFTVIDDIESGRLVEVSGAGTQSDGTWSAMTLPRHSRTQAAAELLSFITTPRATRAMLHGAAATAGRFRPAVHVTLWS